LNEQEKELAKYKEQGAGTKKKHQLAPVPDKYDLEKEKMIGSPDMMTDQEKRTYVRSAMARRCAYYSFFCMLLVTFGGLLVLGAAFILYDHYMMGTHFNEMVRTFYRPFELISFVATFAMLIISGLFIRFTYSDKRGLIIRANDKMVEEGIEPVVIPRRDGDKNKVIEAFYKIKPPYKALLPVFAIAAALLIWCGIQVFGAATEQKQITDSTREGASKKIEATYKPEGVKYEHKVMAFVDRYQYKIGDHIRMVIDLDENGRVLDSSYMIRYYGTYTVKDVDKMKSGGILKELAGIQEKTGAFKELFYYPEVTKTPVKFSDYMINYIDNIREKSEWEKNYEYKVGGHTYITHCKVSYSEGKKKGKDDDRMKIKYEIQQKDFTRTKW